jgi:hypothetical protein
MTHPRINPDEGSATDRVVFGFAFSLQRSPDAFLAMTETELATRVRRIVPGAPGDECRTAALRVRGLVTAALVVCEAFREGRYGTGPGAERDAVAALARAAPGFSEEEYAEAFAAGNLHFDITRHRG